jgi:glutathione peroxidase
MAQLKGKVVLIVNTASKCGFTPQYEGLQKLYEQYKEKNFVILGFPCDQFMHQEPGSMDEIKSFCALNYNIAFPMMWKIDVNGDNAEPLYTFLKEQKPGFFSKRIKWNFTKFLIDRNGNVVKRFAPANVPEKLKKHIEKLL